MCEEMKKVLVTGAGGYIGRHVVKKFLDKGYCVVANDYNLTSVDARATHCKTRIFDETLDLYEKLGRPDIVVHLAWRDGFIHNSNAHMEDLSKHDVFLKKMIDAGVKSLSVMGSMHEVGYWEGEVNEETPCNPMSMYGISKNALRQSVLLYAEGKTTSVKWLRGFYIYGDDKYGSSIFAKINSAVEKGEKEFPFTTGKNKYDFLDIETLAEYIVKSSVQNEVFGVINICSGKPVSLAEQVEWYIKKNSLPIKLNYGAFQDRKYDSPAIWGNSEKIQKIISITENIGK